jgi:DNA-binding MarR family transcriptional regulator
MPTENNNVSNMYPAIDRLIHEPSRYNIMALLYVVTRAEYLFVLNQTEMTSGNLTAHAAKLEKAGYLSIQKKFVRKRPKTFLSLTSQGRKAFETYRDDLRKLVNALPGLGNVQSETDKEN